MGRGKRGREATNENIALLLRAHTHWTKIRELTGASRATIFRVRAKLDNDESLKHTRGPPTGPKAKILTKEFLEELKLGYKINPFTSISEMAMAKGCSRTTIKNGLNLLGLVVKKQTCQMSASNGKAKGC